MVIMIIFKVYISIAEDTNIQIKIFCIFISFHTVFRRSKVLTTFDMHKQLQGMQANQTVAGREFVSAFSDKVEL